MAIIKHKLWVTDVDEKEGTLSAEIVYAEEYEMGNSRNFATFELDDLKKRVSASDFEELIYMGGPVSHTSKSLPDLRQGRIFELHEDDEDEDYNKIHVPEFKPYTDEEIKASKKWTEEMFKNIKWE